MRLLVTILVLFAFYTKALGQSAVDSVFNANEYVEGIRLPGFLDSLKQAILVDTAKFQRLDLKHTSIGTINAKSYSKLFIVNNRYSYKLDIIEPKQVLEFVNEYLTTEKVSHVLMLDAHIARHQFGEIAFKGAILIFLDEKARFNPKVAGLTEAKKKTGNNFNQKSRR
ncbi:MAG TPA: hypothetical protein VNS32_08515 [Flavisolibacter sp.]|nr:hypothetical protein [Flavisolibacter sp.]